MNEDFAYQVFDWLCDLKNIIHLKPQKRALVQGSELIQGLTSHSDGGMGGFGAVVFMTVKQSATSTKLTQRVMGSKSKVSRRTVPCHEALSKHLALTVLYSLAKPLSTRSELYDSSFKFVLVKNMVEATIHAAQDLNQLFPFSTVYFTWIPGLQNCTLGGAKKNMSPYHNYLSSYSHSPIF